MNTFVLLFTLLFIFVAFSGVSSECYGTLGCFPSGGIFWHILHRPFTTVPDSPDKIEIQFVVHTRKNPASPQTLRWDASTQDIRATNFNPKAETRILVGGFLCDTPTDLSFRLMKEAFLAVGDMNIILVRWTKGNGFPYTKATANTRVVGAATAQLITRMKVPLKTVHIIGHSLGAHLAGYAGERLKKVGRITGLDPAGPFFTNMPAKVRLDPTDAIFVDVIHTDAALISLGSTQQMGHLDFFPNDGKSQPGCKGFFDDIVDPNSGEKHSMPCSHQRAIEYFTESINSPQCTFVAYACSSWKEFQTGMCADCSFKGACAKMGFKASEFSTRYFKDSTYYLITNPSNMFCANQYKVTVEFSDGFKEVKGKIKVGSGQVKMDFSEHNMNLKQNTKQSLVSLSSSSIPLEETVTVSWHRDNNKNDKTIIIKKLSLLAMDTNSDVQNTKHYCNKEALNPGVDYQFQKC